MASKKTPAPTPEQDIPFGEPVAAQEESKAEAPTPPPKPTALAAQQPTPEVVQRVVDCLEALETIENAPLPKISFKEGYTLNEADGDVESFEGVIIYTKEMNAWYKDRYKPGEKRVPDCFAPDGKVAVTRDPTKPVQSPTCAACPKNQFGSAADGGGKACKNVRPLYVLVKNPETGEFGVIPRMLRVPPTSLVGIKQFIMNVAADYGATHGVLTHFGVYKKTEAQTHYNQQFKISGRLTAQQRADVNFIRNGWLPRLKAADDGLQEAAEEAATAPVAAADDGSSAPRF